MTYERFDVPGFSLTLVKTQQVIKVEIQFVCCWIFESNVYNIKSLERERWTVASPYAKIKRFIVSNLDFDCNFALKNISKTSEIDTFNTKISYIFIIWFKDMSFDISVWYMKKKNWKLFRFYERRNFFAELAWGTSWTKNLL